MSPALPLGGHLYLGQKGTFLLCVDRAPFNQFRTYNCSGEYNNETMTDTTQPARFDTVIALSIAAVSILEAIIVALAAFSSEAATDAQRSALIASINREKADVSAHTQLFQDMRAYTDFRLLAALANEIEADALDAEDRGEHEYAARLRDEAQVQRAAANSIKRYYAGAYVLEDETFDEQTFVQDEIQFDQLVNDHDPSDDIEQARLFLNRGSLLTTAVAGLAVALFFLILAQISRRKIRYVWFGLGAMISVCGLVALATFEILRGMGALS